MRLILATAIALAATPIAAEAQETGRAAALERLAACRTQSEPTARLACYDAAASEMDAAERSGQLVVMDRAQVQEVRRGLFGFSVPSLSLFGDDGGEEAQIDSITVTITGLREVQRELWVFTMSDGSTWRQADAWRGRTPREGETAVIRRGAIGSFLMSIESRPAVRVRREE